MPKSIVERLVTLWAPLHRIATGSWATLFAARRPGGRSGFDGLKRFRHTVFTIAALACSVGQAAEDLLRLEPDQLAQLGERIWQSEAGGRTDRLTWWNRGEAFASMGIGHFIWYPVGADEPFEESFPALLQFMHARGVVLPAWLAKGEVDCPWPRREAFMKAFNGARMVELRRFLSATKMEQSLFLARRLAVALPGMLDHAVAERREVIRARFEQLAATPKGLYALIDYVNFKGEGTRPEERYNGQGWGLLQALDNMNGGLDLDPVADFADAAAKVLERRVANSNAKRREDRWLAGWLNRVNGYRDVPLVD